MTVTESRLEIEATSPQGSPSSTFDGLIGSADHKTVGRAWIGTGLLLLVAATIISVVVGVEAMDLDSFAIVEDSDEFAQVWSLGRALLLVGGVVPVLIGLATFLVPLQIGAPAIAFSRGAAGAFWTWLLSIGLLIASYPLNGGPGGGQTDFVVLWAVALGGVLLSLAWAMVIIATTVLGARTTGMTLDRVPHTTWSFFVFALIGLFTLPVLMVELVIVYIQLRHGFLPLGSRLGLTGVLDGVSLAPVVYWVAIPVLGMAADVIGAHTGRPVPAHRAVMVSIGLLGILVYGSDYFGFASLRDVPLDNALLVIAIAACVLPIMAVLGLCSVSLRTGTVRVNSALVAMLAAGAVVFLTALASLLALGEPVTLFLDRETTLDVSADSLLILNQTTFHDGIRGMVMGAAVVAIIGALHHWSPKLWGRRQRGSLTIVGALAGSLGAMLWGAGAILAGVDDQAAYPTATLVGGENVELFNLVALIGMALVAVAALAAGLNTLGRGGMQGGEQGEGLTLEWATASPPSFGNFGGPPVVRSASPLADGIDPGPDAGDGSGGSQ
jgi:cytochrome c oxidase subunit 1